jgi:hypothetical protein
MGNEYKKAKSLDGWMGGWMDIYFGLFQIADSASFSKEWSEWRGSAILGIIAGPT